jgi:hypothetical protein
VREQHEVNTMGENRQQLLKKFEQDYEVNVDATDALTYWIIHARILKSLEEGLHHLHLGKNYISGPNQDGNVLILPDPRISDAYLVEFWGKMESFDDFVKKVLARILADRNAAGEGQEKDCGTSCG